MNKGSNPNPVSDWAAERSAPLGFGSALSVRFLESSLHSVYDRLGEHVVGMLRTHRRLAMELEERRESDGPNRWLSHSLRLRVREIPELTVVYQRFEPNLRVPPPLPPESKLAPKSLLRRLGGFIAEAWEEAGETVRQCKAA